MKIGASFGKLCIPLESLFVKKVGNGESTSFWKDIWIDTVPLSVRFPRLFILEVDKNCLMCERLHFRDSFWILDWNWRRSIRSGREEADLADLANQLQNLQPSIDRDRWVFNIDSSGVFSVCSLRKLVDEKLLNLNAGVYKWNNWVPIKVNIHIWRLLLDRLPTKVNLRLRGLASINVACDWCGCSEESAQHIFISCPVALKVWEGVARWCRLAFPRIVNISDLCSISTAVSNSGDGQKVFEVILWSFLWFTWKARNDRVFNVSRHAPAKILDDIQVYSYLWIKNRRRDNSLSWLDWICNHLAL